MFVITGGGSGIGRALAHSLADRGHEVLIIGRRQALLAETAAFSPLISVFCADVSTSEGQAEIINALKPVRQITGLIHNAGIIEPIKGIADITSAEWQHTLATNLNAPLALSQKLLAKLSGNRVLHIGSGVAYFPVKGWAAYCVSKAALSMLTRCWQLESEDVHFASVMPGIIDTDMQALIRQAAFMDAEKKDFFMQLHQDNKLVSPATAAIFLTWLLLDISPEEFSSKEWDIYDTTDQARWLVAPHTVPHWEV
ncbi:SDR family NAD(P)-dependent oxidoreductase [Legionella dresdenensis]|uniref:SDR family NAD(P)-dependent oxidoreductase n=1 Tax=Legionella dresdenensis TaxID=450200 RepID=A0ABV8CII2_9GAMM